MVTDIDAADQIGSILTFGQPARGLAGSTPGRQNEDR